MPSSQSIDSKDDLTRITEHPEYFTAANDVILHIASATDFAVAVDLLFEGVRRMGADVAIWSSFVNEAGMPALRVLLACDPCWGIEYEQQGWYADDPWLEYARMASEPVVGRMLKLTGRQQAMTTAAEAFGFVSTVIIPVPAGEGLSRVGMLCIGSATPGFFDSQGFVAFRIVARSLAYELQAWWLRTMRDDLTAFWNVTVEDLHMLALEHRGQGTKEIAKRLGVTEEAVDCRFRRLNARLGVTRRKSAAKLAAEYALI